MRKGVYIHGYTDWEQERLVKQNQTLGKYIYDRIDFSDCKRILEIGCGVGAQMIHLLQQYPHLHISGLELEPSQLRKAELNLKSLIHDESRYSLVLGDATDLPKELSDDYDAVFMVWVLEHIPDPSAVLSELARHFKKGTKIFITEVAHSGFQVYPQHQSIGRFWRTMMTFQSDNGGDADIGFTMGNLLHEAGFKVKDLRPYPMHFDKRKPQQRLEMLQYWLDLMRSAVPGMREGGVLNEAVWHEAEAHMISLMSDDNAVFYYAFMQASVECP